MMSTRKMLEFPASTPSPLNEWYGHDYPGHAVQFYVEDRSLIESLGHYIGTALAAGHVAVVIATQARRDALAIQLKARGLDTSLVFKQGRYVPLDAAETLAQFIREGWPDAARFTEVMGSIIAQASAAVEGDKHRVVMFGEMVTLLWAEEKPEAALRLEQLWNDLARSHSFSLRCAYPIHKFHRGQDAEKFLKVCDQHASVIPDESYTALASEQDRLRGVALLQQKAQALAELQRTTEDLRKAEDNLHLLVEGVKDYAIFILDPTGHILSWNVGARRIKGYEAQEIIGKHFSVFYQAEDVRSGKPARELKIAASEGRYEEEGQRVRKDGSLFWAHVTITALYDESGCLRGFGKVTRDITERKRAEESRRELSARLLSLQDDERRRLARDLHDSTAQTLSALSLNLALLNHFSEISNHPVGGKALADSLELVNQASGELRSMSYLLHPPLLDRGGLAKALPWYVEGFTKRTHIQVELEVSPEPFDRLPQEVETALFRIVQESLTNIFRHSGSSTAGVQLLRDCEGIRLRVWDHGKGLPKETADDVPAGFGVGIRGMHERVRQLGGRMEIRSESTGTTVEVELPPLK